MGLGTSPLGVAPYGYGTPTEAPVPGGRILDNGYGVQSGSRKINEETRQYEFDTFGRVVGGGDTRQMVLLAVSTALGSSAQRNLGHDLASIEDIGEDFDRRIDGAYRAALTSLVARGLIEIISITIDRIETPGTNQEKGAFIRLRWRDLTDPNRLEHTEKLQ